MHYCECQHIFPVNFSLLYFSMAQKNRVFRFFLLFSNFSPFLMLALLTCLDGRTFHLNRFRTKNSRMPLSFSTNYEIRIDFLNRFQYNKAIGIFTFYT